MENQKFSLVARKKSFSYALNGLKILIKNEHNAWIHVAAMIIVIILGFYFKVSKMEWLAIVIVIGFVFSMEIINSAIEKLADFISPDYHEMIKKVKDLAAAAVLISATTSIAVALIVFSAKIIEACH